MYIRDEFINGNFGDNWSCESGHRCPESAIVNGKTDLIKFRLSAGSTIGSVNSRSKIYHKNTYEALNYGTYSTRFMVNRVPSETGSFYVGIALWQFGEVGIDNEIMFGYYMSAGDRRIDLLSQRDSNKAWKTVSGYDLSRFVNTFHELKFIYTATKIDYYFDNIYIGSVNDVNKIPTKPMTLVIGTRIAAEPLLTSEFNAIYDYVEIDAQMLEICNAPACNLTVT